MNRILPILLLLCFSAGISAQRYRNPEQYLREFTSQNRRIDRKNLMYLTSAIKGEDERRVAKYREMVIEQLKESKKELERVGPYEDYDILQREYVDALTIYIDAYQNDFGIAEELLKNRYNSYEDLKKYFDAVYKAEGKMLEAAYKIEKAEDHFAKMHFFNITRDEETEKEYRQLDEVTLYTRDMTLSFFRVKQHVKDFLGAIERKNTDSLSLIVSNMERDIILSQEEISEYADFEGIDDLYREVEYYLTEMNNEVNETLRPLADQLSNQFLPGNEYRDAQRELEKFIGRHNGYVEDFFATKNDMIAEYLPE